MKAVEQLSMVSGPSAERISAPGQFFSAPMKAEVVANSDRQFVELLVEIEPAERCSWCTSLLDAIAAHEERFRSMAENVATRERG